MSGIYYGFFVIAILLVVRWAMDNELGGKDGEAGIFAMTARRARNANADRGKSRFRRKESDR